ncbi:hypothetical protein MRX96_026130 [Rhipicephalus microplus]
MALDEGMPDSELTESVDVQSASETSAHLFSNISPPSAFCTKIVLTNEPGELCFGWHIRGEKCRDVLVHKHFTFAGCSETTQEQAETSLCRIYCRNVKVDEFFVATESDALAASKKADALFLCPGCGIEPIKTANGVVHWRRGCVAAMSTVVSTCLERDPAAHAQSGMAVQHQAADQA